MKPIADLPAERACSDRTRYSVQSGTAYRTIRAAQRNVEAGFANDLDRDLCATLAAYQAEMYGVSPHAQRKAARELRVQHRMAEERIRGDTRCAEELEADVQGELDRLAARNPELAAEVEQATGEFLARFTRGTVTTSTRGADA